MPMHTAIPTGLTDARPFPPLAGQTELDAEARREAIWRRAERVAAFFALAVLLFAPLVFGEAAVAALVEAATR